jgi:hypothetical protein
VLDIQRNRSDPAPVLVGQHKPPGPGRGLSCGVRGAQLGLVATLTGQARRGELLAERVRCAEQEATLGYRVTTGLTAENHWPRVSARAWAISQRAHHAHQLARARARHPDRANGERQPADRDGGAER